MTAPHFHTVSEAKSAIKKIEHNASGPGSPSGKMSGPPTSGGGGSGSNDTGSDSVVPKSKGGDWIVNQAGGLKQGS